MFGANYEQMNDMHTVGENNFHFTSGKCMIKLCNMGFVTSKKWVPVYLTLFDGIIKIYDSRESCLANPHNSILQIQLSRKHVVSDIQTKDYSQNRMKVINFHCFYISTDNGIFAPGRLLKVASLERGFVEQLSGTIKHVTNPYAR